MILYAVKLFCERTHIQFNIEFETWLSPETRFKVKNPRKQKSEAGVKFQISVPNRTDKIS